MITPKKTLKNRADTFKSIISENIFSCLQTGPWLKFLDLALLLNTLLLVLSDAKIFYFHLVFFILTFGAFYWPFRTFVLRSSIYMATTTALLFSFVLAGNIPAEELIEIPMLTSILVLVFIIAQQRTKAEDNLRKVNRDLEAHVAARTADLLAEIKERQQTEQTLRESEERYRHLVELTFETIVIHTEDKLLYINPSGVKLLNADGAHQLIGKPFLDLVHPDTTETMRARLQHVKYETKDAPLAEGWLVQLDGARVDVEMVTIPILYQGYPAMQTVIRDITARKQAEQARLAERIAIAQDLHDSLGQSLGYLHLKLDEIASYTPLQRKDDLTDDLLRMRDVANAAYEQIRSTLAALMPANTLPFTKALRDQAKSVGYQARFKVQVINRGQESALSPVLQQQLLYLCREALANITKHANAQQVKITTWWSADSLTLIIADDGRGFDLAAPRAAGSFGLRIMEERITQIHGLLSIQSQPNAGTELTLQIPLLSSDK